MTDSEQMWTLVALGIAAIVIAIAAFVLTRRGTKARRAELQRHFGPEYERAVDEFGSPERAERELERRKRRVEHFHFKPLTPADQARFSESWTRIQAEFVDNPVAAVTRANALITEVMRARGYPVERFEQRVQDLSVAHPGVVQHYRAAHELSLSVNNEATATENLRQAVVHYRALFAELLQGAPDTVEWERAHA
ncbi:MAG TPA: hypothetical protein VG937_04285 [Polyangiaceae bacterium]|nr:hypothetical protein [Polyangiaceae bacterium]